MTICIAPKAGAYLRPKDAFSSSDEESLDWLSGPDSALFLYSGHPLPKRCSLDHWLQG